MTVPNIPQRHLQLFRVFPRITANWHNNVSIRRRELFQKERFHKLWPFGIVTDSAVMLVEAALI